MKLKKYNIYQLKKFKEKIAIKKIKIKSDKKKTKRGRNRIQILKIISNKKIKIKSNILKN